MKIFFSIIVIFFSISVSAQLHWINVDSLYQPLPSSVHVYRTNDSMFDGKPNIAYYLVADLKDKEILFDADTTFKRRLTPAQFFEKNHKPLVVVNCTFFSFETNQSLNVVLKDGQVLARNISYVNKKTGDNTIPVFIYRSAIGISKKRQADVAWIGTDSSKNYLEFAKKPVPGVLWARQNGINNSYTKLSENPLQKWKMQTAVGGGPVLIQNGQIKITNEEEMMFAGKAIDDKHPRTAMGYTKDGKLIILLIQGRFPGISEGATLKQEAQILKDLGCWEALNLDGGGSSCMIVNGKNTITPSSAGIQRPVPAVFLIKRN